MTRVLTTPRNNQRNTTTMTQSTAPDDPDLPHDSSETLIAYFPWPSQYLLRLRATRDTIDSLDEWTFVVEAAGGSRHRNGVVVSDDKTQLPLQKSDEYHEAKHFYNRLIQSLLKEELKAAHAEYIEASEVGDSINAYNAKKYINELETQLETIEA